MLENNVCSGSVATSDYHDSCSSFLALCIVVFRQFSFPLIPKEVVVVEE